MVELDAGSLTTRELNRRIKDLAAAGQDVVVMNPMARHNIAVGVLQPCRIRVAGSVGYYSASMLDGPEVEIEGNAGWGLGENLMSGRISLSRDAGASVARRCAAGRYTSAATPGRARAYR